jgi:hypothetical protein
MSVTQPEINTESNERENCAREPEPQNVANPMSGDAGTGIIGGFHDRHVVLGAGFI